MTPSPKVRLRSAQRRVTVLLWIAILLALGSLPWGRFPAVWILALSLPAGIFFLLRHARMAIGLGIACLLQVAAGYGALHLAGSLDDAAALACTLLPPLIYVAVRRQETDTLLALFLSFCLMLIGLMLGGPTLLLPAYVFTAALTLRAETVADLQQGRASHRVRGRPSPAGPVLLGACCGLVAAGIHPLLVRLPALGDSPAPPPASAVTGLSTSFELGAGLGTPLNVRRGDLLRVRSVDGRPVPPDLYLRSSFFDLPGMDRWTTGPFSSRVRDTRARAWQLDRSAVASRPRTLEIRRLGGLDGLVFAPPGTRALAGLGDLFTDERRETWHQDPDAASATTYRVSYQDLRREVAGQDTDPGWEALRELPPELRIPGIRSLLDQIPPPARRSPRELALAIGELLRLRCEYALRDPVGPYRSALLNFLHGTERQGYCMHFASALGILLRSAGIPSRIAVGLQGGIPGDTPAERIYGSQHAHAWVEVPFSGIGWVVFDPTPSTLLQGTGTALVPDPEVLAAGDDLAPGAARHSRRIGIER